jgi:hypothetical protein
MPKNHSQEYLNQRKAQKIIALQQDHMTFESIAQEIMKQKNLSQSRLILGPMEDIERAAAFWKEMREHAERFIKE